MTAGSAAALIPAYREQQFIGDVVRRTRKQIEHVFVIDDGSPDRTAEFAREAGAEVVRHERNQGKGAAIQTGLRTILDRGFRFVVLLDGDGQHLPEEIERFLQRTENGNAAMILGDRMGEAHAMPLVRRLTNKSMSWIISRVCHKRIPDTQCGFRLIRSDLIPHLFCNSQNYDYETEMLLIASRLGFVIESVPVSTMYGDEKSKIHPLRDTVRFFRLLARYL